ncbi:MAG TPA: caspase family protein [Nitrospirales bacterium]
MTRRHPALRPLLYALLLLVATASLGCGQKLVFPRLEFKSEESKTPSIPLTVRVEIPDALKQAQLFYKDSCGVPQGIPLGERLVEQVKADGAGVFEKTFEGSAKEPADAVLSAVMETSEINLSIPRREIGEYKTTVLVRLRVTVIDAEGKTLFNEAIKGEGKWNVTTDGTECTVRGLMLPVTEAMEKLSDRTVDGLTQAIKIRDYAIRIRTRQEMMALNKQGGSAVAPPAGTGTTDPPTLSFRASLEDENRNQVLDVGERLVMRVDVANSGPGVARGVTVVLSGTSALVKEFTNPTMLGDLQPGEKKQAVITSTLPASLPDQQAELLVQVTEAGGFGPPTKKRFVATVQQGKGGTAAADAVEVSSGDVDLIPPRVSGFERRTSYAIVVGIGGYREESVPKLKHAKRDAEVVAKHLTAVAGFPSENVRVLTDEHALLVDVQEIFEEWLPQRANASGVVFIYLVGNSVLNGDSGEIILVPYEGRQDLIKRGYSLRRLQEVLSRLPSRLNLVFADLSFPGANEKSGAGPRALSWSSSRPGGKSRTVIIGSSSTNGPSLPWDAGQHGLFTYHFLKAIRGQADANNNGWVDVGEIIAYLREQVPKGAAELKKQQVPVVSPEVEPDGPIGTFPLSKSRRQG